MDAAVIAAAAAVVAVSSIGIALVALNRSRRGGAGGEAAAGHGETGTQVRRGSGGHVSWGALFDADGQDDEEARSTATYAVIGFYVVAGAVTTGMAYMGLAWGYYAGLLTVGYATLIIGVNYFKARRRRADVK